MKKIEIITDEHRHHVYIGNIDFWLDTLELVKLYKKLGRARWYKIKNIQNKERNELNCKIAIREAELEQKIIKLAKLTKNEKKGESISLLNSFVDLQISHSKAMGVAVQILPTKEVADAYTKAQVSCIDFIETVTDEMIRVVENHNKNNKQ